MKIENRNIDELENRIRQAENGDMKAQYQLGMLYRTKEHLHYKEAFRWLLKAAEQGHAEAQNAAGEMLADGKKIGKNTKEAFKWFTLSAGQGNADACYNLAVAYYKGIDCDSSDSQALYWFQRAVELGKWKALFQLGIMYLRGIGTPVDEEQAEACFCQLVAHDNNTYPHIINEYRGERHRDKYLEWLQKAAEHGIDSAQYELGEAYERGISFRRNIPKAMDWYQKAAAAGNEKAQEALKRLNNQRQALKEQEAYFLQLVEEKQLELIWHPERREECSILFSYEHSAQAIYVHREYCPMSAFREYAMSLLLVFYAEKLAEAGKAWIPYAALSVNYLRKLPTETRENHLDFFYGRIAALYEESGDTRRATWYQKQAVGHQLANEFNLENVKEMLDKMSEEKMLDFCLYVLYHITEQGCFGEDAFYPDWQREQYELQEYVLNTTVKRFADNEDKTTLTRSFIYFLKGIYLKRTRRFKLAESIWKAYLELPNVEEEACFTPSLIHALWGECCLHRTNEAQAKAHFLMVRKEEEPFVWEYVQSLLDKKEVSVENLNQACYEAVANACCQDNGTPQSLKESIDAFFAQPEIYADEEEDWEEEENEEEDREDEEEDNGEEECAYTFDTWYNEAEDGNRFAQLVVGFLYYQGEVVTRSYRLAREWFYLSALQGNAAAQMNLAYMYAHGYGVEADAQQAAQWREKAEANPSLSLKSYRDLLLK